MTVTYNGAPDGLLTYTSPSAKLCMGPSGTYRYGPHNLYVNSASPANQSITVVSGAAYTVVITGSVSVTASGAATGTWTAGTTNFTAATGTLTLGSTSGAGTVHVRRTNSDATYLQTGASARYGLPYEWDSSGVLQGILVEEARTNWFAYSDVTNTFIFSDVTLSASPATDPTGRSGAVRITTSAGHAIASKSIVGAGSAAGNTFSVFARQGSGPTDYNEFLVRNGTTATNLFSGTINYTTGVWTTASGAGLVTVREMTNGWWRIEITVTAGISESDTITCYCGAIGNASLAGKYADFWLPQLERGAWATSPIETFGATVTRAVDTITLATSAFPALGSAFGMVVESELLGDGAGYPYSARIRDVANNNIASNTINLLLNARLYATAGGVVSADLASGVTITKGVAYKQAMSFEANRFAVSVNGAAVTTDASGAVPSGMTTLALGGISALRIRKLLVVPHSYTDGQLQSLSA